MSKIITVKKAKAALQKLRQLTPANPKVNDDQEMTVKEAVFFMADDLLQMTKRGFTFKELSEGLSGEGIKIKTATLNRYLNECDTAKEPPEKSDADRKPAKLKPTPKDKAVGAEAEKSAPENPRSTLENPEPDGQITDEKSDASPEWEVVPPTANEE